VLLKLHISVGLLHCSGTALKKKMFIAFETVAFYKHHAQFINVFWRDHKQCASHFNFMHCVDFIARSIQLTDILLHSIATA